MMATTSSCMVCFDTFLEKDLISPCKKLSDHHCCVPCFTQYLESKFDGSYEGSCPLLTCLFCKSSPEKKCLIPDEQFKQYCPQLYSKYVSLASSLLSIQCSSCHTRKTVFVASPPVSTTSPNETPINFLGPKVQNLDQLTFDLQSYDLGDISIRDMFDRITSSYCPKLLTVGNGPECWTLMKNILLLVQNSERRANLHLRFIKFRPCVWTPCCNTPMCFQCKTNDHTNRTCEEISSTQVNDFLACSQCGIHLVKGDGCDSITCVCGNRFAWSEELKRIQFAAEFYQIYPTNTAAACVAEMCLPSGSQQSNHQAKAIAWSRLYKERFEQALVSWYFSTFGLSSNQISTPIILLENSESLLSITRSRLPNQFCNNTTVQRAVSLWSSSHSNEIRGCELSRKMSSESLFYSLYPSPEDRCLLLAHSIISEQMKIQNTRRWKLFSAVFHPMNTLGPISKHDPLYQKLNLVEKSSVIQEMHRWYRSHQREVHNKLIQIWTQRVNQFLICYGHLKVQLLPSSNENNGYDHDILFSTYESSSNHLKELEKNDRVKLIGYRCHSTVLKVYNDGLVGLRHDDGGNGLYKRERIVDLSSQYYLPFYGISNQHLQNFICYLSYLQSLLKPETLFYSTTMADIYPLRSTISDEFTKSELIQIIDSLDFVSLSRISLSPTIKQPVTWNDLMCLIQEEALRRSEFL